MYHLKNNMTWFFLLSKRYFKKPMFLITILLIPVLSLTLRSYSGKDESVIQIVLYCQDTKENDLANRVIEELCSDNNNAVRFYVADSELSFEKDVQNGTAICGYQLPDNFLEHLKNYVDKNKKDLPFDGKVIKCISLSNNNYVQLANEVIFSSVYSHFSEYVLDNFMNQSPYIKNYSEDNKKELEELRNQYDNLDVNFFEFYNIDGSKNQFINQAVDSYLMLPVRGLILALILLAAMTGQILLSKDIESGFFDAIRLKRRRKLAYLYTLIPCVYAGFFGLFGILLSGTGEGISSEIINMFLYCFMVIGFINVIALILHNIYRFVSVIPLFIIINLIVCPVFINVTSSVPSLGYVRWILPLNYGLTGIHFTPSHVIMLVVGLITLIISLVAPVNFPRKKN